MRLCVHVFAPVKAHRQGFGLTQEVPAHRVAVSVSGSRKIKSWRPSRPGRPPSTGRTRCMITLRWTAACERAEVHPVRIRPSHVAQSSHLPLVSAGRSAR